MSSLIGLIYMIKNTVVYRNVSFIDGLLRTFVMIGLFSFFWDMVTLGYLVDYFKIIILTLSLSKLMFFSGLAILVYRNLQKRKL